VQYLALKEKKRVTYERLVAAALGRVGVPVEEEQQLLELLHVGCAPCCTALFFIFFLGILFSFCFVQER
jgi:hypothetical protein